MVGRIKISSQAEEVRQLFMALEKDAKRIKTCWFCGSVLPHLKLANQGRLTGNHKRSCPLEDLAAAGERCIIVRNDDDETKRTAEQVLSQKIEALFAAMTKENMARCPFPVCNYAFDAGHRLECPFTALQRARVHG